MHNNQFICLLFWIFCLSICACPSIYPLIFYGAYLIWFFLYFYHFISHRDDDCDAFFAFSISFPPSLLHPHL